MRAVHRAFGQRCGFDQAKIGAPLLGLLSASCCSTEPLSGRGDGGPTDSLGTSESDGDSPSDHSSDTSCGQLVDRDMDTLCFPIQTIEECRATEGCRPIEGRSIDPARECVFREYAFLVCRRRADCEEVMDALGSALNPETCECYLFDDWCFPPGWVPAGGKRCPISWWDEGKGIYCPD